MTIISPHPPRTRLAVVARPSGDIPIPGHPSGGRSRTRIVVLAIGPLLALVTVTASALGGASAWSATVPSWALGAALAALVLGIPHGAVDHLALSRSSTSSGRLVGATAYLLVAAAAAGAILRVPGPAFVVVLAMTVWHFGTGDVEARVDLAGRARRGRAARTLQALALGSAPVVLPLTGTSSGSTLRLINPGLGALLTPAVSAAARGAVICLVVVVLALLLRCGDRRGAGELGLLTALGLVASPLVAFAVYFAAWHALRHTARLAADDDGEVRSADLARTFAAGLPALLVTVAVVACGVIAAHASVSLGAWLWFGLALVWGLTVPHMAVVAHVDRARRGDRSVTTGCSSPGPADQARRTLAIGRPLASSSTSLSR